MGYRNWTQPIKWRALHGFCILLIILVSASCTNTRKATYFSGQQTGTFQPPAMPKPVIQNNDLLSITVSSLNPEASAVFNTPGGANNSNNSNAQPTATTTPANGYLVDGEGNIQFP